MTESAFVPRAEPPKAPPSRARRGAAILALATLLGAGALLRAASLNQPFWMDESFTSTLATQPPSMIFHVCAKDVHPPGYFLLMRGWNALCRAVLRPPPPTEDWTLKDFNVHAIETAGRFTAVRADGLLRDSTGVFPEDWAEWPLAPLKALRLMPFLLSGGVAALLWLLARTLLPECPSVRWLALTLFLFSGYTIVWDGVMRSYNASAVAALALALACLKGAQTGRWRMAGPAVAVLVFAALMTNYVSVLHFPGIALAAWIWAGFHRRALVALCLSFLGGAALAALLWGRAFVQQLGLTPSDPAFTVPLGHAFGAAFDKICLDYWSLPFSEAFWRWLAAGSPPELNRLQILTPLNPIPYGLAFALYAAAIGVNVWNLIQRPSRRLAMLFLLAFLPALIVVLANTIKPGSLRAHGRHLYAVAPFFFLFLAQGWASAAALIRDALARRLPEARR